MENRKEIWSRRNFLRLCGLSVPAFAGALPLIVRPGEVRAAQSAERALRIGHLTDVHCQPELGASDGFVSALRHVQQLDDPPQLVLNGGDSIMDCFAADADRTKLQWNLWRRVIQDESSTPIRHCIGNHDIWGWDKNRSGTTGKEDLWGKKRSLHELEIPGRYYSFDQAGWHFVVLDSVHPRGESYHGGLDEEQFAWLKSDLEATPHETPVLVLSHISIVSIAALEIASTDDLQQVHVPTGVIFRDFRRVLALFREHPNVKLCLSGHLHMLDRLAFRGVTYICGGAVSGNWWKGDRAGFDEGYGVVDLYKDGSFDYQYVAYGWTPRA